MSQDFALSNPLFMATQMESESDVASYQHPKRSKQNPSQLPSTSMHDSAPFLPAELISEILSRLPVKTLLQFRSVSKSWLALISCPEFIKTHLSISADNEEYTHHRLMLSFSLPEYDFKDCSLGPLLYGYDMEVSELNHPMKNQRKTQWTAVGSVNGLVCLVNGLVCLVHGLVVCIAIQTPDLFLWNPSIRKYKKLPDFGINMRYAFRCTYGFGYDEFHDDYKVVGFFYSSGSSPRVEVKIYSLKDDSWRSTHYPPPGPVRFFDLGKFVNGKLHWANYTGHKIIDIISIDLVDEKWGKVELPCCGERGVILGVLGNNLSVISNSNPLRGADVWVMKEYGVNKSWTKIVTVKCPRSPCLLISNKDKILLMFRESILLYNLKDESVEFTRHVLPDHVSAIYLESLVSPLLHNEPRTHQE